jgi:hypothetical protein
VITPRIRHIFPSLLLVTLLLQFSASLFAAEINNLYDYEVGVASQSPEDRSQAIRGAFGQVLVKVTGNAGAAQMPALQSALANASQYVLKYTYRVDTSAEPEKRYIRVYFDSLSVNQQVRNAGLPVWGKSRPQLIGWVGTQKGSRRDMLIPDTRPDISSSLFALADSYGLPFMLPLMDLEDQSAVSASDLWGSFVGPLQQASSRYLSDMIVVIRLNDAGNNYWKSSWSLVTDNGTTDWSANGNSQYEVLSDGMQKLAGIVAAAYAPAGGSSLERINIQIDNVNSFAEQARLEKFLESLESVQSLQVRSLQSGRAVLSVSLRGGMQAFAQAVGLSGFVQQVAEPMDSVILQAPAQSAQPAGTAVNPAVPQQPVVQMDEIQLYFEMTG